MVKEIPNHCLSSWAAVLRAAAALSAFLRLGGFRCRHESGQLDGHVPHMLVVFPPSGASAASAKTPAWTSWLATPFSPSLGAGGCPAASTVWRCWTSALFLRFLYSPLHALLTGELAGGGGQEVLDLGYLKQQAFEDGILRSGVLRAQAAALAFVDLGQIQFGGVSADVYPCPWQPDVHIPHTPVVVGLEACESCQQPRQSGQIGVQTDLAHFQKLVLVKQTGALGAAEPPLNGAPPVVDLPPQLGEPINLGLREGGGLGAEVASICKGNHATST